MPPLTVADLEPYLRRQLMEDAQSRNWDKRERAQRLLGGVEDDEDESETEETTT
jgi:hypothetical protein